VAWLARRSGRFGAPKQSDASNKEKYLRSKELPLALRIVELQN
jgi:hypothetical protein